jgi:hypothetical protein
VLGTSSAILAAWKDCTAVLKWKQTTRKTTGGNGI